MINKQDFEQARKYLKLALKGMPDNRDLLYYLGDLSVHGLGVSEPNYTRAYNYFSRCASLKDLRCVNGLGFVYYTVPPEKENEAQGIVRNVHKAYDHFTQAARKGNLDARYNLGNYYLRAGQEEGS